MSDRIKAKLGNELKYLAPLSLGKDYAEHEQSLFATLIADISLGVQFPHLIIRSPAWQTQNIGAEDEVAGHSSSQGIPFVFDHRATSSTQHDDNDPMTMGLIALIVRN